MTSVGVSNSASRLAALLTPDGNRQSQRSRPPTDQLRERHHCPAFARLAVGPQFAVMFIQASDAAVVNHVATVGPRPGQNWEVRKARLPAAPKFGILSSTAKMAAKRMALIKCQECGKECSSEARVIGT